MLCALVGHMLCALVAAAALDDPDTRHHHSDCDYRTGVWKYNSATSSPYRLMRGDTAGGFLGNPFVKEAAMANFGPVFKGVDCRLIATN